MFMAQSVYLFIALIITPIVSNNAKCAYNKCEDSSEEGVFYEHTMCTYPPETFGEKCDKVKSSSLTQNEINEILGKHNELRAFVAAGKETRGLEGRPQPAGIINPLEWDDELSTIAQRWANQCENKKHDECRNLDGTFVGQNIGYMTSTGDYLNVFTEIVTAWYDEVINFDPAIVPRFRSVENKVISHYTQLIWANTTHVGCGGIRYESTDSRYLIIYLVCNYKPGGNMLDDTIYHTHDERTVEIPPSDQEELTHKEIGSEDDKTPDIPDKKYITTQYTTRKSYEKYNNIQVSSLSYSERNKIIGFHNNIEDTYCVSERPARQRKRKNISLRWNDKLAKIAQQWANRLFYNYDTSVNFNGMRVNQNIGQMSVQNKPAFPLSLIAGRWNYDLSCSEPNEQIRGFFDWSGSTEVGCGGVIYDNYENRNFTYLVCNYLTR